MLAEFALVAFDEFLAPGFLQVMLIERGGFDQMAVAVDNWMVELGAKRAHVRSLFAVHVTDPLALDSGTRVPPRQTNCQARIGKAGQDQSRQLRGSRCSACFIAS